jgi:glycosyltransferase involved in cell wall biosynthesis
MCKSVYIVMAVHNGQRYLAEQLDSLLAQTFCDWTLLVRDDGSTDGSFKIIEDYAEKHQRIEVLQDNLGNLGAKNCFSILLSEALNRNADYVACCDQDDVWLAEKLGYALSVMFERESQKSPALPLLVHTDLEVVDAALNPISMSFMKFAGISQPEDVPLSVLLVQNHVVGCTMLVNRALLEKALPVPEHARMHDWWLALCARSIGNIHYLNRADIQYRQHHENTLGATKFWLAFCFMSRAWRNKWRKWQRLQPIILRQILALSDWAIYNKILNSGDLNWQELECLDDERRFAAMRCASRAGLRGHNLPVTILFYLMFLIRSD